MTTTPPPRAPAKPQRDWTTKTLARQLVAYLKASSLGAEDTIDTLMASLKNSIVEEEVGTDLGVWALPKKIRPEPRSD